MACRVSLLAGLDYHGDRGHTMTEIKYAGEALWDRMERGGKSQRTPPQDGRILEGSGFLTPSWAGMPSARIADNNRTLAANTVLSRRKNPEPTALAESSLQSPDARIALGRRIRYYLCLPRDPDTALLPTPELLMTALIELEEITKNYGSFRALDRVSLTIEAGHHEPVRPQWCGQEHAHQGAAGTAAGHEWPRAAVGISTRPAEPPDSRARRLHARGRLLSRRPVGCGIGATRRAAVAISWPGSACGAHTKFSTSAVWGRNVTARWKPTRPACGRSCGSRKPWFTIRRS